MIGLAGMFAAALAVWFWQDAMRARERALAACRRACRSCGAQLLDDTVALDRLRLQRRQGRLRIARRYRFEFSLSGNDRRPGRVRLVGPRIVDLQLELPDGLTLLSPPDG